MTRLVDFRPFRRTVLIPAAFIAVSLVLLVVVGIPTKRDLLAVWLLLGLLCFSLTDLRGYARGSCSSGCRSSVC